MGQLLAPEVGGAHVVPDAAYLGSQALDRIYQGAEKVWPPLSAPPDLPTTVTKGLYTFIGASIPATILDGDFAYNGTFMVAGAISDDGQACLSDMIAATGTGSQRLTNWTVDLLDETTHAVYGTVVLASGLSYLPGGEGGLALRGNSDYTASMPPQAVRCWVRINTP